MIKQTTVVVENTPGRLYEVLKTLSKSEINLNGISIADSTDYGMFRLILSDPVKGQQVLREAGFIVQSTDVLCLSVKDEIGSLQKGLACLAKEQINIQYTYAFGLKAAGKALIITKTDDNEKARRILLDQEIEDLSFEDLSERLAPLS